MSNLNFMNSSRLLLNPVNYVSVILISGQRNAIISKSRKRARVFRLCNALLAEGGHPRAGNLQTWRSRRRAVILTCENLQTWPSWRRAIILRCENLQTWRSRRRAVILAGKSTNMALLGRELT